MAPRTAFEGPCRKTTMPRGYYTRIKNKKCEFKDCDLLLYRRRFCHKHGQYFWVTGSLEYLGRPEQVKKTNEIIRLHTKEGWSTAKIARELNMKKNTIIWLLRNHKVLRKNMGYDTEMRVGEWLDSRGVFAIHQKGDAPYDYLIGKKRVDVKMSHKNKDGVFRFEIFHQTSLHRKTSSDVDSLFLVFHDDLESPIYELAFSEVEHLPRGLTIRNVNHTKYPLQLIGYL